MEYTIVKNEDEMAKATAQKIAALIRKKQSLGQQAVIGLATGSTPIKVYAELVRMHNEEALSFKNVTTFNLDEYIVDKRDYPDFYNHSESYHGFMNQHLFNHIDVDKNHIHIPDGMADDLDAECRSYEKKIQDAGGIDLLLVGIGKNGHIGFNEPGSPIDGPTSVVNLTPETIAVNREKFGFAAQKAISMGLGTVMNAKEIVLIATGDSKTPILKNTGRAVTIAPATAMTESEYQRKIGENVSGNPSRILHYHPNVEAIVSQDAGKDMLISVEELRQTMRR